MKRKTLLTVTVTSILLSAIICVSNLQAQGSSKTVRPGEEITVKIKNPGGQRAWVGIFRADDPDNNPISFSYLRDLQNNTFSVNAPKQVGKYQFRVFKEKGDSPVYKGDIIKVVQYSPTFTLSATTVKPNQTLTVTYSDEPKLTDAWIGFYRADDPDEKFISFIELKHLENRTYSVTAPGEKGIFNFRIFLDNGYIMVGKSENVTVS